MTPEALMEAILFFKAEPVAISGLSRYTQKSELEIKEALRNLEEQLSGRGLQLVWHGETVMLGTRAEAGETIESITKEELNKDLGKAAVETLSIIIYRGPVSRSEIDYIRGVNSTFILRNLMIRGLVERIANPKDARSFLYQPSVDLVSHLGLAKIEDIPEYEDMRAELKQINNDQNGGSAKA
jgi:segregation and condensation protein B